MLKKKPVKNIQELRYKLAELYAALENDEVEISKAKVMVGAASAIINTCKVELLNNQVIGETKQIDFISDEQKPKALKVANG
jgi:hypothetical protein